jgi:type IV secretion system protein VirD4
MTAPRGIRSLAVRALAAVSVAGALALAAETHFVAAAIKDPRRLGEPLARPAGIPMFPPWAVFAWRSHFAGASPRVFARAETVRWCTALAVVGLAGALQVRLGRRRRAAETYGTARWGTTRELRGRGLLEDAGLVLCQTEEAVVNRLRRGGFQQRRAGRLVRDNSGLHVFVYAPSGSGKTVAISVPSLLTWTESVCVWDTKRELWQLTAGWRSQFSRCIRFEPTSRSSDRYNPLAEIRKGTDWEVRDTQAVAEMLADPEGKGDEDGGAGGGNEKHFRLSAQKLIEALILHVLYAEPDKTLPGLARFVSDPARSQFQVLEHMMQTRHLGDRAHPAVAAAAREMMNRSEAELSGVFSTTAVALGPYSSDPVLARAVSASDFRIRDLMHGKVPTSLYLVSPPSDLSRLRPVIRLLLNQIGKRLTEENVGGGGAPYKHRLLFLLDEFPTLGRMHLFADGIAYFRGYGIKLLLICQSVKQLAERYGDKNSIVDNCDLRLTYHANDVETAEYVSKALGTMTYEKETESVSGERGTLFGREQASRSTQDHSRPLMTPDEVQRLPRDQAILFGGGAAPYRAKKVIYYDDPRFRERAAVPPPGIPDSAHAGAARSGGPVKQSEADQARRREAVARAESMLGHHKPANVAAAAAADLADPGAHPMVYPLEVPDVGKVAAISFRGGKGTKDQ